MANRRAGGESRAAVSEPPARLARHGVAPGILAVAVLCAALVWPRPAGAGPLEGIAGWEGDGYHQGYGFATAGLLLVDGGRLVLPVRVSGSYLYYNYRDRGAEVSVRSPGAAASLGLRVVGGWGTATLSAGGELRWERRLHESGSDPAATVARGGAVLEAESDLRAGRRLRPFLLFNYSGSARYLYGRALLRWQCTNLDWRGPVTWFLGLEGVGQGNRDTDAAQGGAAVECSFTRARLSLSLHGGWKSSASSDSDRRTGGYLGAGVYRRF